MAPVWIKRKIMSPHFKVWKCQSTRQETSRFPELQTHTALSFNTEQPTGKGNAHKALFLHEGLNISSQFLFKPPLRTWTGVHRVMCTGSEIMIHVLRGRGQHFLPPVETSNCSKEKNSSPEGSEAFPSRAGRTNQQCLSTHALRSSEPPFSGLPYLWLVTNL